MKKHRFGFTGSSNKLQRASAKLEQWWYIVFSILGTVIFGLSTAYVGSFCFCDKFANTEGLKLIKLCLWSPWSFVLFGVVAMFYGGYGIYNDLSNLKLRNEALKKENSKTERYKEKLDSAIEDLDSLRNKLSESHDKLVTTWLKGCCRELNLDTYDRVTIYFCIGDHFYVLARHSSNPKFVDIHRQKFSKVRGVISEAWEHNVCVDTENIPSYDKDPDGYRQYMNDKYGYSEEKVEALTMKSCKYVATSILEADNPVGVIIFESEQQEKFKKQKVVQIIKYCKAHQSYMTDFIKDGIRYNKSVKVTPKGENDVDHEFLSIFQGGGEV